MRPVLSRQECGRRLDQIFPSAAFDSVMSNPMAAAAVAALIYVDAVVAEQAPSPEVDRSWARPSTVLWMSDAVLLRQDPAERLGWHAAALRGKRHLRELLAVWGIAHVPWYADNSREPLRDDILPRWQEHGAVAARAGLPTTSSRPRWALTSSFADLFSPALLGADLGAAIESWAAEHLTASARTRTLVAGQRARRGHAVEVALPDGTRRMLEPGDASLILKGVVEQWASRRLRDPVVLAISEPGDKVYVADGRTLQQLGMQLDAQHLLPDALLVDVGTDPLTFWFVEAVATDGPVDEARKARLLSWAQARGIPASSCEFLSAFASRNDAAARLRLKDVATDTFAWYLDEPERELVWYDLET